MDVRVIPTKVLRDKHTSFSQKDTNKRIIAE